MTSSEKRYVLDKWPRISFEIDGDDSLALKLKFYLDDNDESQVSEVEEVIGMSFDMLITGIVENKISFTEVEHLEDWRWRQRTLRILRKREENDVRNTN